VVATKTATRVAHAFGASPQDRSLGDSYQMHRPFGGCRSLILDAVDCSKRAIANGKSAFGHPNINWIVSDAESYLHNCGTFNIVVMYGLLHCLPSLSAIEAAIRLALNRTQTQGYHIVAVFNDGPHDLSAHPNFSPTLGSHVFYRRQYEGQDILSESETIIRETHPHNGIPHFHSLTRLLARRVR
jgi:tellurite methyltransferase